MQLCELEQCRVNKCAYLTTDSGGYMYMNSLHALMALAKCFPQTSKGLPDWFCQVVKCKTHCGILKDVDTVLYNNLHIIYNIIIHILVCMIKV